MTSRALALRAAPSAVEQGVGEVHEAVPPTQQGLE